jgi:hypothetical protein
MKVKKNGAMEGREHEQWRRGGSKWSRGGSVCIPIVAHLHHFDEEQDPDPDPHHNVLDPQHYFALQTLSLILTVYVARYGFT